MGRRSRSLLLSLLLVGAIAGSSGIPASTPAASAQAGQPITFGNGTISGIQGVGFEQNIRVGPGTTPGTTRIYTSAPGALSSVTSWLWKSTDLGKTFKWVKAATPLEGKLPLCAGGGDTELAIDTAGHLYFNDLTLVNFTTGRSDDEGATFVPGDCAAVETTPNDRQWYAVDGDPTNPGPATNPTANLWLTYNIVGPGAPVCGPSIGNNVLVLARSPLGGVGALAGNKFNPSETITPLGSCDEAIMGNVEVSPIATTKDGASPAVKHVFIVHDNATFDEIRVARCRPVPFTDPTTTVPGSGVKCVDKLVSSFPGAKTGGSFPNLAVDSAGNLFVLWQQAPLGMDGFINGDTLLYWSSSTDEGDTWTAPVQVPTPGLHNNVLSWIHAGDAGRVDIVWYGTPAVATAPIPPDPPLGCTNTAHGPDTANGLWGLYFTQTLNGTAAVPSFATPVQPAGHHLFRGTVNTVMGGQCGSRQQFGDFLQMDVGPQGEAVIAYASGIERNGNIVSHSMVVRQNGGPGLFASNPTISIPGLNPANSVTDPSGDGTFEQGGTSSANLPNLDILSSSVEQPLPTLCAGGVACYRVKMVVNDLASLAPPGAPSGDTDPVIGWQTQWQVPSTDPGVANGGRTWFVIAQSNNGGAVTCFAGESGLQFLGGGAIMTYPADAPITGAACNANQATDTITIDVPLATVPVPMPLNSTLYSVTATTLTAPAPFDTAHLAGIGGTLFNLIDVAQAYNFTPGPACDLTGTAGPDVLKGTVAGEVICGLGGNDVLYGFGGADTLIGDAGNDNLYAGPGADTLLGGTGNDVLYPGLDNDPLVDGGTGVDGVNYFDATASVTIDLVAQTVTGGGGNDTLANIANASGSSFVDTITGNSAANQLDGRGLGDTISGGGGNDVLVGGAGVDSLDGGSGTDIASYALVPGGVTASISGGGATADGHGTADTFTSIEDLQGGGSVDSLTGSNTPNKLFGSGGNDSLFGLGGNDYLDGGAGASDTCDGGAGTDQAVNCESTAGVP